VAGRIPQDFIDDLIERADIGEIVGSRIQLKKHGREFKAPCPFHSEKTPSFTVSPQKGFYHCFGCGAHGTAIGFLMEYDRLEFPEAIEELAQILGVDVPREDQGLQRAPVSPVFDVLNEAARLYRQALKENPPAIDYLKARGLDGEIVQAFGIGYAPPGWDYLLRQIDDDEDKHRRMLAAGLIAERDSGGYYDRFRERIVFPIRDSRGRTIGFGGRIIGDEEPKYLNSPETPVFHKGRELYGLYEARQANRKLERILVVEGYMDVVSLACNGIHNVVGTLGTATTPEHLRRLFRATQEVIFCFDGDRAGREAAWRALQISLPEMRDGRQVRFLFLLDGEDPDSVVRSEGAEGLRGRLKKTVPLSDYLLGELSTQSDTNSIDGRARLAELARPLLGTMPEGVYKELLTDRLAEVVGMGPDKLADLLANRGRETRQALRADRGQTFGSTRGRRTLARQAIQLILNYPSVRANIIPPDQLAEVRQRGVPLLVELLEITAQRPDIKAAGLIERFRDRPEGPHLEALLAEEIIVDETGAEAELADSLKRIVESAERQRLEELVATANERALNDEEKDEFRKLRRGGVGPA
jgi:DNA primase